MDNYNPPTSTDKKKLLVIPLIVLLFCMASLVAVAYSYNSTVTSTTDIESSSYEITFKDGEQSYTFDDTVKMVFDTTTVGGKMKYTVNPESDNQLKFSVYMINAKNTDGFTLTEDGVTVSDTTESNLKCTKTVTEDNGHYNVVIEFSLIDDTKPAADSTNVTITVSTNNA